MHLLPCTVYLSIDFLINFFYQKFKIARKKIKKDKYTISKVMFVGLVDKNRQKVFDKNLQIVSKRAIKSLMYLFYLIKIN